MIFAASQVVAIRTNTCAVSSSGAVFCWGDGTFGLLGGNITITGSAKSATKVSIKGLETGVTAIGAATWPGAVVCAITSSKQIQCWGYNTAGLGHAQDTNGDMTVTGTNCTPCNPTPVVVTLTGDGQGAALDNVQSVSGGYASCAVRLDGTVWCWGLNECGQLGPNNPDAGLVFGGGGPRPIELPGLSGMADVSANEAVCARSSTGAVSCWGNGTADVPGTPGTLACTYFSGKAATGIPTAQAMPNVSAGTLAVTQNMAVAVQFDAGVFAWGINASAALGHPSGTMGDDGNNNDRNPTPQLVQGLP